MSENIGRYLGDVVVYKTNKKKYEIFDSKGGQWRVMKPEELTLYLEDIEYCEDTEYDYKSISVNPYTFDLTFKVKTPSDSELYGTTLYTEEPLSDLVEKAKDEFKRKKQDIKRYLGIEKMDTKADNSKKIKVEITVLFLMDGIEDFEFTKGFDKISTAALDEAVREKVEEVIYDYIDREWPPFYDAPAHLKTSIAMNFINEVFSKMSYTFNQL